MSSINKYTYEYIKDLGNKISNIKNKKDLAKIIMLIHNETKQDLSSNDNCIYMFFDNLSNETYEKIEIIINDYYNKQSLKDNNINKQKKEYVPYFSDEFTSNTGIGPKLKFSNKEKNLIKRQRYDKSINIDTTDVIYKNFDITTLTDSTDTDTNNH